MAEELVYIAAATFCASVIGYAVKITWQISRIEREQQQYTVSLCDNLEKDIVVQERNGLDRMETLRKETGEMGLALRSKIHEMETWNRDTFVRKDSFEMVINRVEKSIEKMADKLEEKIDKLVARGERS